MSAMGQKQTWWVRIVMSAFKVKADVLFGNEGVRI